MGRICRTGYATAHSAILPGLFPDVPFLDEMSVVATVSWAPVSRDVHGKWRLPAEPHLLVVPRMTAVPADWDSRHYGWSLARGASLHVSRLVRGASLHVSRLARGASLHLHWGIDFGAGAGGVVVVSGAQSGVYGYVYASAWRMSAGRLPAAWQCSQSVSVVHSRLLLADNFLTDRENKEDHRTESDSEIHPAPSPSF
ncbi:hypothetical protein THAOC_11113 [Thalassiosira oceanica]|uniref:Uncharacterized protein n=1 Tax=Thalassiosira oceanica TaxID=159749 RepID=K0SQZ3_THAOC|nr:hypothetical protein THAOC_11113 [Thalassiosira oceanica]|eukprot:EJK67805.1 hypothetical protein THAOC_11113 [Thalassiosira oceanica]